MHRLFRTVSGGGYADKLSKPAKSTSLGSSDPKASVEKLRGYRDLAEVSLCPIYILLHY